ncbi:hypothetical protein J6P92_01905 [bacterium]|nr:hypothetical protein [bacterium]
MGMSASQARLLSITSRLSNNELRAQNITNAKLRLDTRADAIGNAYIEALNSQQLMFVNYDDNGDALKVNLTPAVLYDYAPMKNQYMLVNQANKFLISYTDKQNFENTDDLAGFLECYNLVYDSTEASNKEKYAEWEANCEKLKEDYEKAHEAWEEKVKNWTGTTYNNDIYDKFVDIIGTSINPKTDCYTRALTGGLCYLHVLNFMLDYDGIRVKNGQVYTTTTGDTFQTCMGEGDMGVQVSPYADKRAVMKDLSDAINDPNNKCDRSDKFTPYYHNPEGNTDVNDDKLEMGDADNIIQQAIDAGRPPSKYEQLKSDYKYDTSDPSNPKAVLKTLKEKLQDLYYLILCFGGYQDPSIIGFEHDDQVPCYPGIASDYKELLINFTEGDLKMKSHTDPPPEPELTLPDPPEPVEGITILRDQEKSQWYVNMWHALNGSETSNTVDPINFDNDIEYIQDIPNDVRSEYRFIVENKTKDTKQTNYVLLDQNLYGSAEWLEFALKQGVVSMVQAQYYNPDEDSNKTDNARADGFKWNSIVYSSARDIVSQDNAEKIAVAEVAYENEMTEIQALDKKYNQDLKKLDAEHNALETEYDTIKDVIMKNTERSFKAFS